jgi:hypothetical protein
LIIVEYFLDKDLHAFILEGSKKNELGTCDSKDNKYKFCKKEGHYMSDSILFKE